MNAAAKSAAMTAARADARRTILSAARRDTHVVTTTSLTTAEGLIKRRSSRYRVGFFSRHVVRCAAQSRYCAPDETRRDIVLALAQIAPAALRLAMAA